MDLTDLSTTDTDTVYKYFNQQEEETEVTSSRIHQKDKIWKRYTAIGVEQAILTTGSICVIKNKRGSKERMDWPI